MGKLWKQLLTQKALRKGWHIARSETRQDFAEDLFATDVYGQSLHQNVQETLNRLKTGTYQAKPPFRIEVPKGSLGFRPGTVVQIPDRVVLSAIILLLAPEIDKELPESVYSWRLKDPLPRRGPIFRENDITELPFLKQSTIRKEIDPFDGWYALWPEFDEVTRRKYQVEGYRYLATSDIAAYFENIQIPILRDQLLGFAPREQELVNLLCHFLETWSERTSDGGSQHRGIPQGNSFSSFLGNIFLLPLDQELEAFAKERDIAYFRYMDDVRIFTKSRDDARLAIFQMARKLRELHLNVQTAKTQIYDESRGEITDLLIDDRVDDLSSIIEHSREHYPNAEPPFKEKAAIERRLAAIAKQAIPGKQKIYRARKSLDGLDQRCFSRWMTAHQVIGSDKYVGRLLTEISRSADQKLTRKLVATTKRFPRKRQIGSQILSMIRGGQIIFPYQEAECLRAARYLSHVPDELVEHAWGRLISATEDRYLRMEAAYLLARVEMPLDRLKKLHRAIDSEPDPYVQAAKASVIVQIRGSNQQIVRDLVFHPNDKIRELGKFFRMLKNDPEIASDTLKHALRLDLPWVLCDSMAVIHLIAASTNPAIRTLLLEGLREPRYSHPNVGIRKILQKIYPRTQASLTEAD